MRVLPYEVEFAKFLDIGNGTLHGENDDILLPDSCFLPMNECIIQSTFGQLIKDKNYEELNKCAILSARNVDVNDLNETNV